MTADRYLSEHFQEELSRSWLEGKKTQMPGSCKP